MKTNPLLLCLAFLPLRAGAAELVIPQVPNLGADFILGADVSSLAQIEEAGGRYYDQQGVQKDMLLILRESGVNWVRLRLWHNPVDEKGAPLGGGNNTLERTLGLAKRAKALGFKVLLDFHYSDFWADPGKQTKPAAWKDFNLNQLADAIYTYTGDTLKAFIAEGACPDMVQIGNELNGGMLWPEGKTWRAEGDPPVGGMNGFTRLLKEASRAVRENDPSGKAKALRVMIHLADGGDNQLYRHVFDAVTKAKVDFDIIGLSYYPYWHGSIAALTANVHDITKRYKKDALIAETAYGFTTADSDKQGNVFQVYEDESAGFRPTVQGQATEIREVVNVMARTPQGRGLGVFYWEPGWIPVEGAGWKAGEGNNWENQAMFDFSGKALDSMQVWKAVRGSRSDAAVPASAEPVTVKVTPGEKKTLPSKIKIIYNDDSIRLAEVQWDPYDFSKEKEEREFVVSGVIKGGTLKVSAHITVSSQVNLIPDPSFESGKLTGWTLNGPAAASFAENNKANAHSGSWTYKYWLDKPFRSILRRTFKNIPNGDYTLSVWAMGGGGEKGIKLFASDFGSGKTVSMTITNTGWQVWKQYIIPVIKVTNGQCTVGIYLDTNADNWGNFDDIEFSLVKKQEAGL